MAEKSSSESQGFPEDVGTELQSRILNPLFFRLLTLLPSRDGRAQQQYP